MERSWRSVDFERKHSHPIVLRETGDYYFWIMKIDHRERSSIRVESLAFDGDTAQVRFASGTGLVVDFAPPSDSAP